MKRIFKKLVFISAVSSFGLLVGGLDGVKAQQLEKKGLYQKPQASASKTEARIHSRLAQSSWPNGYYKSNTNDAVYWLNASEGIYCLVQNPSQMKAFGGFGQVRVTGTESFKSGSGSAGQCGWPDGKFLRRKSEAAVYGTYEGWACLVTSPQMMNAFGGFGLVTVIDDSSNIFATRKDGGECLWPK